MLGSGSWIWSFQLGIQKLSTFHAHPNGNVVSNYVNFIETLNRVKKIRTTGLPEEICLFSDLSRSYALFTNNNFYCVTVELEPDQEKIDLTEFGLHSQYSSGSAAVGPK